jgi:phenylpyruvate tautomerase PptA (4-oxalocrotonate tautomerase family)
MPLWIIYHPPTTFTDAETKRAFARAITDIYTATPLPAFYVNVIFNPIKANSFYIGGVARPSLHFEADKPGPDSEKPFIRISIQNIARTMYAFPPLYKYHDRSTGVLTNHRPNEDIRDRFLSKVDAALKPFIDDAGYDWEYSVEETSRDLWKIQGMVPPMPDTEAERVWVRMNEAVPFDDEDGGLEGNRVRM